MENYQSCWEILGIDPIRDKKSIKRAYAKLLKVTRPDDDPEAFKKLQSAYEEALGYLDVDWYWEDDEDDEDDENEALQQPDKPNVDVNDIVLETQQSDTKTDSDNSENEIFVKLDKDFKPDDASNSFEATAEIENTHDDKLLNESEDLSPNPLLIEDHMAQEIYLAKLKIHIGDAKNRDILGYWEAFLTDELLLSIDFKQQVSFFIIDEFLALIEQLNSYTGASIQGKFVHAQILYHLDKFFGWQTSFQQIENNFSYLYYDEIDVFFDALANAEAQQNPPELDNIIHSQKKQKQHKNESSSNSYGFIFLFFLLVQFIRYCAESEPSTYTLQSDQEITQALLEANKDADLNGNSSLDENEIDALMEDILEEGNANKNDDSSLQNSEPKHTSKNDTTPSESNEPKVSPHEE